MLEAAPTAPPRRVSPAPSVAYPPPRPPHGIQRSSSMTEVGPGAPSVNTAVGGGGTGGPGRSQSPGAGAKVASLRSLAWKSVTSLTSIILPGQVCVQASSWFAGF